MSELAFEVRGVKVDPYAAQPTLVFTLGIDAGDRTVESIALRCQIRIEPQRRRYSAAEEEGLLELFGETPQWGDSLKPFLWTHATAMVSRFAGSTVVELPVPCTYDFEVAAAKYLHSLRDGEAPLIFLFNGNVFARSEGGPMSVEQVPWHCESTFRLPVAVWRELMDRYFPNSGWLRLDRGTLDALLRYKATRALPTWEQAIELLLKEAGEAP